MIHSSMSLSVGVFVASARPAWYIINEVLWKTRRCFSADYIRHCLAVLLSVQTGLCRAAGAGCRRPIISDVKVWGQIAVTIRAPVCMDSVRRGWKTASKRP